MKVFISTTTFAEFSKEPLEILKNKGLEWDLNSEKRKLTENEIAEILKKGSYVGLLAGTEPITRKVLENATSLKIISRVGAGMDNVDTEAAKKHNIEVCNTPFVLIDSMAELSIGLILVSLRKISLMDRKIRSGVWKKEMGALFKDKTLGIIGFGKIGRRVGQIAKAFGARVVFYDIESIQSEIAEQVPLKELFNNSDIISIHLSSKEQIISGAEIAEMKDGVCIINTSRGSAIDENSLYQGLSTGKIAHAALDVYSNEPYFGKLTELDNIILTPHIGSYAREARVKMEVEAVKNLINRL